MHGNKFSKNDFLRFLQVACCVIGYTGILSELACYGYKSTSNHAWFERLPACSCQNPDKNGIVINDGWAKDVGNIKKYHSGATESFRSYPAIKTSEGHSGQQCCYGTDGRLITGGRGAGTPDKVSTCNGEDAQGVMKTDYGSLWGHYIKDVRPWDRFGGQKDGWVQYNQLWPPNNKNGCDSNVITK